jgi:hypothetical protein
MIFRKKIIIVLDVLEDLLCFNPLSFIWEALFFESYFA